VHGDGGGAGAALDAAGGDDQAGQATGGVRQVEGDEPGELAGQVGDPVGPGEQAAGTGGERGPDVGRAVVVADGDERDPAAAGQVGQGGAADQGDRRAAGQGGGETGVAGIGHEDLPAGRGLDGMPQGVGGAGIVVGDEDQRGHRWDGCDGHGHPPGALWGGLSGPVGVLGRSGAGKDGRAAPGVEATSARMCITLAARGCGRASFAVWRDE
jgi:hypothetical protein